MFSWDVGMPSAPTKATLFFFPLPGPLGFLFGFGGGGLLLLFAGTP